jgi:hypothetical protein
MLLFSYVVVTCAMLCAAVYLVLRMRLFLTTSAMLIGFLLLIYGPAFLSFTLTSGRPYFLYNYLMGVGGLPHPIFHVMEARGLDIGSIVTSMNFSVALMYFGIIAGIELVGRVFSKRAAVTEAAIWEWNKQPLKDDSIASPILLVMMTALALFMFYVSISESHLTTIERFFSIQDNNARSAFRAHFSGSPIYAYRVALSDIAPMFIVWGLLAGVLRRSWKLLAGTGLLFVATSVGKVEMLSKAPPVFFLVQLALAVVLVFSNRASWKFAGLAVLALALAYAATCLTMFFPEGHSPLAAAYARIFETESQSLMENFAVFPSLHPFMWGSNIRPVALLLGKPFEPAFSIVANIWYGTYDVTTPSVFIADAWADFGYAGVLAFSIAAAAICRAIDLAFLAQGKTVLTIAILCAAFMGVFTLTTTALSIALFSGGLLLAPLLAVALSAASRASLRSLETQPD